MSAIPFPSDVVTWSGLVLALLGAATSTVLALRLRRLAEDRDRLQASLAEISDLQTRGRIDSATAVELLPDPVVQTDAEGRILLANGAFARLVAAGAAGPRVVETRPAVAGPDGTRQVDEAIEVAGGLRWYSWAEADIRLEDGTAARLRSGREITGRIATERALEEARAKAEEASTAKSRFLATVSHEFRTPLAGILGMSDLVLGTRLDPEQLSYVQGLRGSAEALQSLIEEVLDFSRIEAGRLDLADEPFEIEPLVQGMVELLAPRAQDKGIEICCFVARTVPRHVRGDRDRLRQVLFNLVGNAVKFTGQGGVGLAVDLDGPGTIRFTVSDTGPGIAPDRLGTIFEEFDQGGLRTTREAGTGLGLAITRRIVERMGGSVAVESTVNRGSTFTVRLALPTVEAPVPAPHPVRPGLRALIVGNTPYEPNFLARRLGERAVQAIRAASVDQAKAVLARGGVDVLLADGALGEAEARLLSAAARAAGVSRTVILLSPFERRQLGSHRAAGFDAYLTKPVRTLSLLERLGEEGGAPALRLVTATTPVPVPAIGPRRVLLAEDNEINALLAIKSLEKLGALVDWARDGTEALAKAEEAIGGEIAYDLVLMDMRMPGLDGFEVTRRIREREAEAGRDERLRIVALTASLHGHDGRLRETAGFDGFLMKPFSFAALAGLLADRDPPLATAS